MSAPKLREILVVDDAEPIRQYLDVVLRRAGYNVRVCSDASEACWEIASNPPHYVVSDWQMPVMDGAELCQWVRTRKLPNYIYFILMTAHEKTFDMVDGLNAGADGYLQKPIHIEQLLAQLRCGERILLLQQRLHSEAVSSTTGDVD